jgi:preprotein translocase subunit SecG
MFADLLMILLMIVSLLLILVVLLQRGRGGGLAGAFGGMGGQSAFGTKAGDVFTKITIGLVTVWVLLAGVSGVLARRYSNVFDNPAADVSADDPKGGLDAPAIPIGSAGGSDSDTGTSMGAVGTVPEDKPDTDTQPSEEKDVKPASTDGATSTDDPPALSDSDSATDKGAADADTPTSAPSEKPADDAPADSSKPEADASAPPRPSSPPESE